MAINNFFLLSEELISSDCLRYSKAGGAITLKDDVKLSFPQLYAEVMLIFSISSLKQSTFRCLPLRNVDSNIQ